MKNLVLGGGVAGLSLALLDDSFIIIDQNPLGQLNSKYILGPRLIQKNAYTEKFFKKYSDILRLNTVTETVAKIGYEYYNHSVYNYADENFKKIYSTITRGEDKYEDSFLSASKNEIEHYIFQSENDCYSELFIRICNKLESENRIIKDKAIKIDTINRIVRLENSEIKYDNLVSTVNANIFNKIVSGPGLNFDFSTKNKNFYVKEYTSADEDLYQKYSYVYSINSIYTRKTFYNGYVVYESEEPKQELETDCIHKVLNLPIQIINSYNITKFNGVHLLGRYAQWSHQLRFDTILSEIENRIMKEIYA